MLGGEEAVAANFLVATLAEEDDGNGTNVLEAEDHVNDELIQAVVESVEGVFPSRKWLAVSQNSSLTMTFNPSLASAPWHAVT